MTNGGETELAPGMCAGFPAGSGDAHQLVNPGPDVVEFLEVGDRTPGDAVEYPDDDLAAKFGADGKWHYLRKDGTPFWRVSRRTWPGRHCLCKSTRPGAARSTGRPVAC